MLGERDINKLSGGKRFSKILNNWKISLCSGDETITTKDFRFGHIPSEAVKDELTGSSFG